MVYLQHWLLGEESSMGVQMDHGIFYVNGL